MPNKLAGMRGYLSGGMEYTKTGDPDWRTAVRELTKHLGVLWMSPLNKPILDNEIDEGTILPVLIKARRERDYDEVTCLMRKIRHMDLRMMDVCDFMVVRLDSTLQTTGTYEEIVLANRQKKPIIIWYVQGKEQVPLWFFGMFPHKTFFGSLREVVDYLNEVDRGLCSDEPCGRWIFWDF